MLRELKNRPPQAAVPGERRGPGRRAGAQNPDAESKGRPAAYTRFSK